MNTIIDGLRAFFCACPLLEPASRLGVDYLGRDATEYVIEAVPTEPVVQQYADGGSTRQYAFVFASREAYGVDTLRNMANKGFYEALADWIEEQSNSGNFPSLPAGKQPVRMEVTAGGYLFDASPDTGRYQIQCRLIYYQK